MERTVRRVVFAVFFFLLVGEVVRAEPPDVPVYRSFKDWEVGCDNTRRCTVIGLQPEDYADIIAFLRIERAAGGDAVAAIRAVLSKEGLAPGDPVTLTIDGAPMTGVASRRTIDSLETEQRLSDDQARRERSGAVGRGHAVRQAAAACDKDGARAEVSLDGAVAALLFIDDVQGRLDTVNALIRRGLRPATIVPAASTAAGGRHARRRPARPSLPTLPPPSTSDCRGRKDEGLQRRTRKRSPLAKAGSSLASPAAAAPTISQPNITSSRRAIRSSARRADFPQPGERATGARRPQTSCSTASLIRRPAWSAFFSRVPRSRRLRVPRRLRLDGRGLRDGFVCGYARLPRRPPTSGRFSGGRR